MLGEYEDFCPPEANRIASNLEMCTENLLHIGSHVVCSLKQHEVANAIGKVGKSNLCEYPSFREFSQLCAVQTAESDFRGAFRFFP